jgi:hypothetical protein
MAAGDNQLRSAIALNDIQDGILAQPQPMAYFPVRLAFADELQHFGGVTVCLDALTRAPAEHDSTLASGTSCKAG